MPKRPVLTWKQIRDRGDAFAVEHGLEKRRYPLDIELLIEQCGIMIEAVSELSRYVDAPACIAPNQGDPIIYVDADQYRIESAYFRFSLAHELAHWLLHKDLLLAIGAKCHDLKSWRTHRARIKGKDHDWMESQAEELASYLIAPCCVVESLVASDVIPLLEQIPREDAQGMRKSQIENYASNPLRRHFGISTAAAATRLRKSDTWKAYIQEFLSDTSD